MAKTLNIGFILLPFAFLTFGPISHGQKIGLIILTFVLLGTQVKTLFLRGFVFYLAGWLLVTRLMLLFAGSSLDSHLRANLSSPFLVYGMVATALYVLVANSKLRVESFFNIACIGALVQTVLGYLQWIGFFPVLDLLDLAGLPLSRREVWPMIFGTLQNPNFLSAYLAISLPFFLRGKWKFAIPFILLLIFQMHTSSAIVALAAATILYVPIIAWIMIMLSAGLLYGTLIDQTPIQDSIRWGYWLNVAKHPFESVPHFFFGYGPGRYLDSNWPHLHNEWLQIWFEFGATGAALLGGYILTILSRPANKLLLASFIIACVNAVGNYPFRVPMTAFIIIIILALLERENEKA